MRKSDLRVRCVHWLLELSATAGAWCAAAWLVANRIGSSEAAAALHAALRLAPLVLPLAAIAHRAARGREANEPREADWSDLCRAAGLASAIVGAALYQRIDASLLLPTLLLFAGLNALALAAAGRATTLIVKRLAHSGPKPKTLLVGGGRVARRLARTLLSENGPGVELLGYVDSPERPGAGNLARLGTLAEVASLVDRHAIERVFVALPATRYGELPAILRSVSSRAVDVVFAPDVPHLAGLRLDSVAMSGVPLITARAIPDDAAFFALKRVFDAAVAGLLCVLLAPVLGLIALAVKLT
ncbi:MAG TPA: hypothetical protein VGE52_15140, partial [Pirellulales bacterium]